MSKKIPTINGLPVYAKVGSLSRGQRIKFNGGVCLICAWSEDKSIIMKNFYNRIRVVDLTSGTLMTLSDESLVEVLEILV